MTIQPSSTYTVRARGSHVSICTQLHLEFIDLLFHFIFWGKKDGLDMHSFENVQNQSQTQYFSLKFQSKHKLMAIN